MCIPIKVMSGPQLQAHDVEKNRESLTNTNKTERHGSKLPSLNGLRAICIFMVIGDHLFLRHFIPHAGIHKILNVIVYNGGLGVGFFFVISGFLITRLLINENETNGNISLKAFYLRRLLRIFPAYYLLAAIYFLLQFFSYLHLSIWNWISVLTYTTQFSKNAPVEILHLWSLSVEELFYLVWPLAFILFFRRQSLWCLYASILLFPVLRFINYDYPAYHYANTIFCTGDALLIGCLTAIHYIKISKWVIEHSRLVLLAFPLLLLLVSAEMYVYHLISIDERVNSHTPLCTVILPALDALAGNKGLITNLLIALIIVYSINIRSYWFKMLNLKTINYLGLLSYSIYLWQELFITPKTHAHFSLLLVVLFIFTSAMISYHLVEKPLLSLKDRINITGIPKIYPRLRRVG